MSKRRLLGPFAWLAPAALLLTVPALPGERPTPPPSASPAAHPSALVFDTLPYEPPPAERVELGAGSIVYLAPDRTLPLVELAVAIRAGAFLEAPGATGLAEIGAALLRRGGAGDLGADELDQRLDLLGADLDTLGGERRSGLRLSVPSWELAPALDLVFDILARPRFEPGRLEILRSNALESMGRRNQDPLDVLQREWGWLLFGDFYGSRRMTPESLERVTRAAISDFHDAHWRPENLILALSGDFDRESMIAALERRLESWGGGRKEPAPAIPWPPPAPGPSADPGLYLAASDASQAKVLIGHRLDIELGWTAPERTAIEVLQEVLGGGGAVSRLGGRLRTSTGLVYRTWANLEPGPDPPGYFRVFFETDPSRAARAIELAIEEIERLRSGLVHPRELEVVRSTLLDRIPGRFDTAEKIAGRHSENELLGRPADYWRRHIENLRLITREDVRHAARRHLRPDKLLFLVVTPDPGEAGTARLEKATGHPATRLPSRDPLTLEPRPAR